MKTGQIKKKMSEKGFGFIQAEGREYFFHSTQCITSFEYLNEGDNVQFDTQDSPKGPRAIDVERI